MRIHSVQFENFRLLRHTILPLQPLTVLVGPNNSGKSSVLDALGIVARNDPSVVELKNALPYGADPASTTTIVGLRGGTDDHPGAVQFGVAIAPDTEYLGGGRRTRQLAMYDDSTAGPEDLQRVAAIARSFRVFSAIPPNMRQDSQLVPQAVLNGDGSNIAVVLDRLRDDDPERFEAFNRDLAEWLPDFDRVLFRTPQPGMRGIALRTRAGRHSVHATHLSEGTLTTLGLLAMLHTGADSRLIGIEEPERGIHPRLLRNIRDLLLRVAHPTENGVSAPSRQVIVTTHSPYFLDLFRDLPECVVIADRRDDEVTFTRLADHPDIDEIVMAGPIGEAWFTGVLGGVPIGPERPPVYPTPIDTAA